MQHQDNNKISSSLEATLAKARENAKSKGLFITDDDIEAYARGDLDKETTAILEMRMTQDLEFAAEVNAEMALADGIRQYTKAHQEEMNESVETPKAVEVGSMTVITDAPIVGSSSNNWQKWLIDAAIALFCISILILVLSPKDKNIVPPSALPNVAEESKASDTSTAIYSPAPPAASVTARLALWAASIVSIEVIQQQAVAMKGKSTKRSMKLIPNQIKRDSFFTGVITQIAGKKYVLASSEAVSLAANSPSAIVAHDFSRNKFDLHLIGKDDLFGVAVLEIVQKSTPIPPGLVLAPTNTAEINSSVLMFGNPLNKKQIEQKAVNGKLNQQQNGCILVQTPATWPSADGPMINAEGQITGLVTPFAGAAFPRQKNDKTERCALTSDFITEIVQRIIDEHTIPKPYLGLGFEQVAGTNEVKIYKVLPGSPASPYEEVLMNERIDSINSKSVKNLIEVATVLSRIPPRSVVSLTHSTANGPKKIQKIYSKVLDNKAMETVADAMVEDMPGFSMVFSPGSPQVEYKGGAFENGIYYVQAACGGSGPCPDNIRTKADLGAHLQGMALLNDGRLRLYNEIKNIEREHNISFNTNRLCH